MILIDFATKINGDSVVGDHDKWITVDSIQMGVGRSISSSGGGRDREVSNPSFSEVTCSKSTDISSADLWYQAIQGKSLGNCTIHFVQTGADGSTQIYLTIILHEAIVSSYSASSGGDRPSESFSMNYTKIEYQYDAFDGAVKANGTPKKWDLMANKAF
jgi:type VI secretion system secreted protein Hcp